MQDHTTHPAFIELPKQAKNITGQRFGRLVALGPIAKNRSKQIVWLCQCDCGNTIEKPGTYLLKKQVRSCGCLRREKTGKRFTKHGLRQDPLYTSWHHMIRRCTIPTNKSFMNYGARGIRVCDEWLHSVEAYYDHVTALPHYGKSGYTLDRVDNNGDYKPGNVRWATRTEQSRNRRSLHIETFDGKTQCVTAWENELNLPRGLISKRLRRGWTIEEAVTVPPGERR